MLPGMPGTLGEQGQCPHCELPGPVGGPCSAQVCERRGYHFVPGAQLLAQPADTRSPRIGTRVGDYLLVRSLGKGGFGEVFQGEQPAVGLQAAIKLIHSEAIAGEDADSAVRRFEHEARALATLNHPNIVRLMQFGEHGGAPYMAMEFVPSGLTLSRAIRSGEVKGRALDLELKRSILDQLLDGLQAAHTAGIVHRDIKPANLMLQPVHGNPAFVRILDFGLAKFLEDGSSTSISAGTPLYLAPEQVERKHIGPWTDLYAVGVVAYLLLFGVLPFSAQSQEELIVQKFDGDFDVLSAVRHLDLPPSLQRLLSRVLCTEVEGRIQSASVLQAGLARELAVLGSPADAEAPEVGVTGQDPSMADTESVAPLVPPIAPRAGPPPPGPARRARWPLALVVIAALAFLGVSRVRHLTPSTVKAPPVPAPAATLPRAPQPEPSKPAATPEPKRSGTLRAISKPKPRPEVEAKAKPKQTPAAPPRIAPTARPPAPASSPAAAPAPVPKSRCDVVGQTAYCVHVVTDDAGRFIEAVCRAGGRDIWTTRSPRDATRRRCP